MQNTTEVWKDIEGYEGLYQVSNQGRIKSLPKFDGKYLRPELVMKQSKYGNGYLFVRLRKNKCPKNFLIHRLVAQAFIPNNESKPCVNHIDGNKTNNRIENLEWCTYSDNMKHAYIVGLWKPQTKLTEKQIKDICYFRNTLNWGATKLSKFLGISKSLIESLIYYRYEYKHLQKF